MVDLRQNKMQGVSAGDADRPIHGGRLTVGMPVVSLDDPYIDALVRGVADGAATHDVNLVIYVLDGLHDLDEALGSLALLDPRLLDGVIMTAGLTHREGRSPQQLREFQERWEARPMVAVSFALPGVPAVMPDSYVGMREAVEHLIDYHGYSHIAFIKGPASSANANDRYRAYVDVLGEHGLEVDDSLIVEGNYTARGGSLAARDLLNRSAELDAIVCASDDTALGVLQVLQARGIPVPDALAVVGFDDIADADNLVVPLTTVKQPVEDIGRRALEELLSVIRGEPVQAELVVPTHLVVRRSCGCYPVHVLGWHLDDQDAAHRLVTYEDYRPSIESALAEVVSETGLGDDVSNVSTLVDAFWQDLHHPAATGFVEAISLLLQRTIAQDGDLIAWHAALSKLRQLIVPFLGDRRLWMRAEDLLQQARSLVDESRLQLRAQRDMLSEKQRDLLQVFSARAANLMNVRAAGTLMSQTLRAMDVASCYLSVIPDQTDARKRARLLIAYQDDNAQMYDDGDDFEITQLVPPGIWRGHQALFSAVVLPLYVGEESLGIVWFEGGLHNLDTYRVLRQALSGVVFRSNLVSDQREARRSAELATERAELALRDAVVAQRHYVETAWRRYSEFVPGYYCGPEGQRGATRDAWLPVMSQAVCEAHVATALDADGRQTLGVPLKFGGELIGVLGFSREQTAQDEGGAPWSAEQIRLVENVVSQVSTALETQRLMSEAMRRAERLAVSAEISSAATSMTDLDALLKEVVDLIRQRFDLAYAGIFLTDDQREWAVLVSGTGEAGKQMLARGHRLRAGGRSMVGACVAGGKPVVAVDTALSEVWRPNPLLPDIRSELALPLISHAEVIGAMTIQDESPGAFREEDITILQTLADQLANAIENARLLKQMQQNLRELRAATGRFTMDSWRDYVGNRQKELGYRRQLLDLEQVSEPNPEAELALRSGEVVVSSLDGNAMAQGLGPSNPGTPVGDSNELGARAGVGVPIRLRDEILGVLNLRFEDDHVPAETMQLIEQVADRLATSLETARLLEVTQRAAQRERLTGDLTRRMRESLDVDEVLRRSARDIREAMDAFKVSVRLAPKASSDDALAGTGSGGAEGEP